MTVFQIAIFLNGYHETLYFKRLKEKGLNSEDVKSRASLETINYLVSQVESLT